MKEDVNNEFIIGFNTFLKVEYSRLKNSEQLRRDLDKGTVVPNNQPVSL